MVWPVTVISVPIKPEWQVNTFHALWNQRTPMAPQLSFLFHFVSSHHSSLFPWPGGRERISVSESTSQSSRTAVFLQPISEPLRVEILPAHMKEMWAMRDLQQLQFEKAMPAGLMHYTSMSFPQLEVVVRVWDYVSVCVCVCVYCSCCVSVGCIEWLVILYLHRHKTSRCI